MDLSDSSEKIPIDTTGIDPGTFQLVAQRLNHYATPGPFMKGIYNYIPETNQGSRVYNVASVLYLQFVLHVMLFRP
jgi:hypothetical protein